MKILISRVKVVCLASEFNGKIVDLLCEDGKISYISEIPLEVDCEVLKSENLHVSNGWLDFTTHYTDPGSEWLESLDSLQNAAAQGGFTEIVGFPNTQPIIQTKESIAYFKNFSKFKAVKFHNYAAITKDCEGVNFTDLMDLYKNGAVGFTDGRKTLQNADILLKSLQYLYSLNTILINRPEDKYLSMFGQIHEGITSTMLGLKGIPSASEELMILRDLKLLEYAALSSELPLLHFSAISTNESVRLIREAKKKGLAVSCDIAAHQLAFIDSDLMGFDTNLKVNPPFRSAQDLEALKEGLEDGTIDLVISDHNPLDSELKNLEFDLANFGVIGLQTAFSVLNTYSELSLENKIEKITSKPRQILRLGQPRFEVGAEANLTFFDPTFEYMFTEDKIVSLSRNSPFINKKLKGKALAIINNGQYIKL